jgi:D-xylonolactonase
MIQNTVRPLINEHCHLGENPLWNAREQRLYWTDIGAGKIHRFDPQGGRHEIIYEGVPVGGFTFQANGDLLLFRVNDLALLHPGGGVEVMLRYADDGLERFNDVIADPEGRVFAGSIGTTNDSGGLYRVDLDGSITCLWRGTGCSNGMGFTPDLKAFYWTCSTTRRIFRYAYDRETGELSSPVLFHQAAAEEGIPDGLAVDGLGNVWSARWDGHGVMCHDPSGKVFGKIEVPVAKVTSLCFGGAELDRMFITTAGGRDGSDTADGAVFGSGAAHPGMPEFESRIRL